MLNLTELPLYQHSEARTICPGETILWHGQPINAEGTYEHIASGVANNGCDSVYTIHVSQLQPYTQVVYDTTCIGETIYLNGHGHVCNIAGWQLFTDTTRSVAGCDSIYWQLNVLVGAPAATSIDETACGSFEWCGTNYTESGSYQQILTTTLGCDSVVTLNLTIHPEYHFYETYTFYPTQMPQQIHGLWFSESGTASTNGRTIFDCDSVYTITVIVNDLPCDTLRDTICSDELPYSWRGQTIYAQGEYGDVTTTMNYRLELTVNQAYNFVETKRVCESYVWHVNGQTYTTSGVYTLPGTTVCGCDSTYTLRLTIDHDKSTTENRTYCYGELVQVGGTSFAATADTTFSKTYKSAANCDSVVTYTITVNTPTYHPEQQATVCQNELPYLWHGQPYSVSGIHQHTDYDANNCPTDIYTLNLEVLPTFERTVNVQWYQSAGDYQWHGQTINQTGTYYDRQTAINGCDSTWILNFHLGEIKKEYENVTGCDSVKWHGRTYYASTIANDTIFVDEAHNYDSIYIATITINHAAASEEYMTICAGKSYLWHGTPYTSSGDYTYLESTALNCDSVLTLHLTVTPAPATIVTYDTICAGETYDWVGEDCNGNPLTLQAGLTTTSHLTRTVTCPDYDCNLTYELFLLVRGAIEPIVDQTATICQNEAPYVWRHQAFNSTGIYYDTLTASTGCDSVIALKLTVYPTPVATLQHVDSVCFGQTSATATYTIDAATTSLTYRVEQNGTVVLPEQTVMLNATRRFTIPTAALPVADDYVVYLTPHSATCTGNTTSYSLKVHPLPTLSASLSADSICFGTDSITINLAMTGARGYAYSLKKGNALIEQDGKLISTDGNYTFRIATAALVAGSEYTVTVTAGSQYGCSVDTAMTFFIRPLPRLTSLSAIPDNCETLSTLQLAYTNSGATVLHYQLKETAADSVIIDWRDRTSLGNSGNWTITPSAPLAAGKYKLTVVPENAYCLGDTITRQFTISPVYAFAEEHTMCQNETYTWHGTTYDGAVLGAGTFTYHANYTTVDLCDSIYTLTLTVHPTYFYPTEQTICLSESYDWHGHTFLGTDLGAGVHVIDSAYTSIHHCDSIYRLTLTVGQEYQFDEYMTICEDKPFTWREHNYPVRTQGTYIIYDSLLTEVPTYTCDSVYVLHLTVTDSDAPIVTDTTICFGSSFDWVVEDCNGNLDTLILGLTASTHQFDTLICSGTACNPIYELILNVLDPIAPVETAYHLCPGETINWRGQTISAAGQYEDIVTGVAAGGCDSVYRITVTQSTPQIVSTNATFCFGEPVVFNSKVFSNLATGNHTLRDTIRTTDGCDSIYMILYAKVGQQYYDSISRTACDSYYDARIARTYTHTGIYKDTLTSVFGCDSIIVLNLTIGQSYEFNETFVFYSNQMPVTLHEYTYTNEGQYTRHFTTQSGCDSVYNFTITVLPYILPRDTAYASVCQSQLPYTWRGRSFSTAGWYEYPETDSVHVLSLTVRPVYQQTFYENACDTYEWHDSTYTASGTYHWRTTAINGCDSTEILELTIGHPSAPQTINMNVCQGQTVTIGSSTFLPQGDTTVVHSFANASGCDSTITYHIIVTPYTYAIPEDMYSICSGQSMAWRGHTYTQGGTYYDSIVDANGCATTIYTLILTENTPYFFTEDIEVSENALPYVWTGHSGDTLLSTNGDYYEYLTASTGCDSTYHIHFHVNFVTRDTVQLADCDSLTWRGKTYTTSGLVSDTVFKDVMHEDYDIIHFAQLTIHPSYHFVEDTFAFCGNNLLNWHCQSYGNLSPGYHLLTSSANTIYGCDSVYQAVVLVQPAFADTISYAACPSQLPYNWRGQLLDSAGMYTDYLTTKAGCDSTFTILFTIQSVTGPDTAYYDICQESDYDWGGNTIHGMNVGTYSYYQYYTPDGECDSTYHMLQLNVLPTYHEGGYDTAHICEGETYDWYGLSLTGDAPATASWTTNPTVSFVSNAYAFDYDTIKPTALGCDSLEAHLHLVVHTPAYTSIDTTICDSLTWESETFYYDTLVIKHLSTPFGCDSTVRMNIVVYHSDVQEVYDTACSKYYWNKTPGIWYTESGIYDYHVAQLGGLCDSVYRLNLTIYQPDTTIVTLARCDAMTWAETGLTYTETGIYPGLPHTNVYGCDSLVLLNLTIQDSLVVDSFLTSCDLLDWRGMTYTASTVVREQAASLISGCDSVTYWHITINQTPAPVFDTIRDNCRFYIDEFNKLFTATTDDVLHLTAANGCDSVVYRHIEVNHPDTVYHTLTGCEIVYWNQQAYYYTNHYQQDFDCDSVVMLDITVNRDKDTTIYATAWDSYVWDGTPYSSTGVYTNTYASTCGCDSVVTLYLTINDSQSDEETQIACQTFYWPWNDYTYTTTGDYTITNRIDVGLSTERDSTRTLHLTVEQPQYVAMTDTACDYYAWHGQTYYADTIVVYNHTEVCDNADTLHLTVFHRDSTTVRDTACAVITIGSESFFRDTTFKHTLHTIHGCDSVVTYHLTIRQPEYTTVSETSCGTYSWDNVAYTESGSYTSVYTNRFGCDSVVTLNLSIYPTYNDTIAVTTCDYYTWNNQIYTTTGFYTRKFNSVTGCDSVVTLALTKTSAVESLPLDTSVCDQLTWNNVTYTQPGLYSYTTTGSNGCDSTAYLYLRMLPHKIGEFTASATSQYTWGSETYYESGDYTRSFPIATGCDSIVTLHLTINNPYQIVNIADTACDLFTWDGVTYSESGLYTRHYTTLAGVDSVVNLHLTITHDTTVYFAAEACDSYTWDGTDYTTSGSYTKVYTAITGCDSIVTMNLTILGAQYTSFSATTRNIYTWAGQTYNTSGDYTRTFTSANGCDSVVTLNLTVVENILVNDADTACYQYAWGDSIYTVSTIHTQVFPASTGVDSIVTMTIIIQTDSTICGTDTPIVEIDTTCFRQRFFRQSACDSIIWRGQTLSATGYYHDTVAIVGDCDSIYTIHFILGATAMDTIDVDACHALTMNGETFTESGIYTQHLTTTLGCDSLLTIRLTVRDDLDTLVHELACDSFAWLDTTYFASGLYTRVFNTADGCDSVVTVRAIVNESKIVNVVDSIHCDSIVWEGDTIRVDGLYSKTLQTFTGCDSVVNMTLNLLRHTEVVAPDTTACDSIILHDVVRYVSGIYVDTLQMTSNGCDSIVTTNVTINPTLYYQYLDSVAPPFYVWDINGDTIWQSGQYTDTIASLVTGCDSVVILDLVMTDSIILDPVQPFRIDTFGYCPGDTAAIWYNLVKGHPTRYTLAFDMLADAQGFTSVLDTTPLPNHGLDSVIYIPIPDKCQHGIYYGTLQLFDDFSSSEYYIFAIAVNIHGAIVNLWTDVVAINNVDTAYSEYQWYINDVEIQGATKQYYSDGEDLYGFYRAKIKLTDSTWVYTCEQYFDLRTDSLELVAYPTPAPMNQPVTIKALGILIEKLQGSVLTITKVDGTTVHTNTNMTQRTEVLNNLHAGLYIATINVPDGRTAFVKFTIY